MVWAASGPAFGWSDSWQLVVNTGTTIVTFLMVFLLQHAQARDTAALHAKLDELIRVNGRASDALRGIEERSEDEIAAARQATR